MNFRFLNIPVYIHPTFWLFLIFFTDIFRDPCIEKFLIGLIVFISLLVHEYGHALTAYYFGGNPQIVLEAFGGRAEYRSLGFSAKKQFLITLNGPLLESLLIALSYTFLKLDVFESYYVRFFLYQTFWINTYWCLLNLIPVAPLDGGQLLFYLLERKFGEKGQTATLIVGLISVAITAPLLCLQGYYFFGILLAFFGIQNFQILQGTRAPSPTPFASFNKGIEAIKNNDIEKGKMILKKLLRSKDTKVKTSATEALAKLYLDEKDAQKSYELLLEADPELLKEGKYLLCKLAFEHKNFELASKYSNDIYLINPTYEIAVLNSKTFSMLNRPEYAGAWIETASLFEGISPETIKELLLDKIYDGVRNHPYFLQYVQKINIRNLAQTSTHVEK